MKLNLRKQLIINPRLQYTTVAVAIALGAISSLVVMYLFNRYFQETLSILESTGIATNHPVTQYISQQHDQLIMFVFIIFIWFALMNAVVLVLFTHRIAGPAYRIKKCMEDLLAGELDRKVKVRDGDFFQDSAELLDQIREKLKQQT